ncbi:T-cell surface antigen CD2 isoform X2 [Erinaceus europaeus]|uniref:T-cell surface antigen CD2 isoform X2 n=1 Tax=Erinaceus europaeus TaxID=9365 RepID=A0A1S2ZW88_ERIEU|nr:T-cell surface antigen CD2 isoform X2 [Erinaceus europaeus]
MSLACHILASCLLTVFFSRGGAETNIYWVPLNDDFKLDCDCVPKNDLTINDITWHKGEKIAQHKKINGKWESVLGERYKVLENGTLIIKQLKESDVGSYEISIYNSEGKSACEVKFELKIQERVSKPNVSWDCNSKSLTCQVTNGTDTKLKLSVDGEIFQATQKTFTHKWQNNQDVSFHCTVNNNVSSEAYNGITNCFAKVLDIYFIIGVCTGGTVFLIVVALLVFYISKRRKQNQRKDDEEVEIKACRTPSKEKSQKPHQIPGPSPQNPASVSSHPPPPPGHRLQAPAQRPPPRGLRVPQQQQQRKPVPAPGMQMHQQKGPPLPRPRAQPKMPQGPADNS